MSAPKVASLTKLMRAFGAEWRTANIKGKVLSKPTKSKWRAGWMIGDQNLEFDHGQAFWKPAAREVLTSTGCAVPPAGSAVPLPYVPYEEDQHEQTAYTASSMKRIIVSGRRSEGSGGRVQQ